MKEPMIIGNQSIFALESGVTRSFASPSLCALGFFIIHIGGRSYGVRSPEATMLSNSFDEVENRIVRRGSHIAPFSSESNAGLIADAFRDAVYGPEQSGQCFLGFSQSQICDLLYSNHLMWAPDGDAAFDDGSYVLQFDVGDQVRLIAYQLEPWQDDYHHNPHTLRDQWLKADDFYSILEEWCDRFKAEWVAAPKASEC